jgi:hypothetical protein
MTTYIQNQLETMLDDLIKEIRNLDRQRSTALLNGKIDNFNFQLLGNNINSMSNQVSNLHTQIVLRDLNKVTIDEPRPGAMLETAIDQLNDASRHLDDVHKALLASAQVINVVTDITYEVMKLGLIPI